MDLFTYPNRPGSKERRGTSEEAAHAVAGSAAILRNRVLKLLQRPDTALTADEIATQLGESILSVRPRVSELARQGKIARTGAKRFNASGLRAHVWRAVA